MSDEKWKETKQHNEQIKHVPAIGEIWSNIITIGIEFKNNLDNENIMNDDISYMQWVMEGQHHWFVGFNTNKNCRKQNNTKNEIIKPIRFLISDFIR